MGAFQNYPYADVHQLNLDWIIKKIREVRDKEDELDQAVSDAQGYAESAQSSAENAENYLTIIQQILTGELGYVTPEMFGAVGDGFTDDTEAIRQAFHASSNIIVFSPKTYLLNLDSFEEVYSSKIGIEIPSNKIILGNGATIKASAYSLDTAYIMFATEGFNSLTYDPSIAENENIVIVNLNIDGNVSNLVNSNSLTGMAFYKTDNVILENINMTNLCGTDGGGYGVILAFCNNVNMNNGKIDRSSRSNIYCWESQNVLVNNMTLNGSTYRDCVTCGANETLALQKSIIKFTNCHMEHLFSTGTHIARFPKDVDAIMENCTLIGNENVDGISIPRSAGSVNLTIRNCDVRNCTVGINATGQNTFTKLTVENSHIEGNDAIILFTITELFLSNNRFVSTNTTTARTIQTDNGAIIGNIFENLFSILLQTTDATDEVSFINNYLKNFTTTSYLAVCSGSGYQVITGNCASDPNKYIRVYAGGKAIGNHFKVESTSLDTNEYNS